MCPSMVVYILNGSKQAAHGFFLIHFQVAVHWCDHKVEAGKHFIAVIQASPFRISDFDAFGKFWKGLSFSFSSSTYLCCSRPFFAQPLGIKADLLWSLITRYSALCPLRPWPYLRCCYCHRPVAVVVNNTPDVPWGCITSGNGIPELIFDACASSAGAGNESGKADTPK